MRLLRGSGLREWCVEDRSGRWGMLPSPAAPVMLCDDRPSETRGSYGFVNRAQKPLHPASTTSYQIAKVRIELPEKLLIACIQAELGWKGFDAGRPDGVIGGRTRSAAAAYLVAHPNPGLGALEPSNYLEWCDALSVHEPRPVVIETKGSLGAFEGKLEAQVRTAERVLTEQFQIAPRDTITFYVSSDAEWLTDNNLRAYGLPRSYRRGKLESFGACEPVAEFGYQSVFVCVRSAEWNRGEWFQQMVMGHEYFHALSSDLSGERARKACCYDPDLIGPLGPEWLKEGGAQYAALVLLAEMGIHDLETEIGKLARAVPPIDLSLEARNARSGYYRLDQGDTRIGVLATHALVLQAGRKSLPNYYRYLGYGLGHEEAFRWAFGQSMGEFQPMFEEFLKQYR